MGYGYNPLENIANSDARFMITYLCIQLLLSDEGDVFRSFVSVSRERKSYMLLLVLVFLK